MAKRMNWLAGKLADLVVEAARLRKLAKHSRVMDGFENDPGMPGEVVDRRRSWVNESHLYAAISLPRFGVHLGRTLRWFAQRGYRQDPANPCLHDDTTGLRTYWLIRKGVGGGINLAVSSKCCKKEVIATHTETSSFTTETFRYTCE
ncbi:hypothetical protein LCGC14_1926530 [marine sediment metagenome]|uniref:Uncharacterized protein n=1 Tax=marine sediment metagenome TaxID=412755 RepID=A0A0F9IM38_9ZZZZ